MGLVSALYTSVGVQNMKEQKKFSKHTDVHRMTKITFWKLTYANISADRKNV